MGMEGLAAPQPEGSATRVLVVEDDRTVSEVVARYLGREGYAVEEVADGSRAVERALQSLPDLVVVDLMIPGLDGLEVCRRLRQAAPIPVIMLTAKSDEADRIAGLELGADDYVSKPFSPRELMARIRSVLRRAQGEPWPNLTISRSTTTGRTLASTGGVLTAGELSVDTTAHETRVAGRLARKTSSSNSRAVSSNGSVPRKASCAATSIRRSPASMTPGTSVVVAIGSTTLARRNTALTRAVSSRGENGFDT